MLTADKQFKTALEELRSDGRQTQAFPVFRPINDMLTALMRALGVPDGQTEDFREDLDNIAYYRICKNLSCMQDVGKVVRPTWTHKTHIRPALVRRVDEVTQKQYEAKYVGLMYAYLDEISQSRKMPVEQFMMKIAEECNEIIHLDTDR